MKAFKLGATGRYPFGKAGNDDDGELRLALVIDRQQGIVRLEFGKPVSWLGIYSSQARELAAMLLEQADALDRHKA